MPYPVRLRTSSISRDWLDTARPRRGAWKSRHRALPRRRPVLADLSIAITGSATPGGRALRAVLAEKGVPVERVRFLEAPSEEAILSEYAGQAILIAPLEPEATADRDLIFL